MFVGATDRIEIFHDTERGAYLVDIVYCICLVVVFLISLAQRYCLSVTLMISLNLFIVIKHQPNEWLKISSCFCHSPLLSPLYTKTFPLRSSSVGARLGFYSTVI